jgi:undecaprenyl diphosphate synthase
METDSGFPRSVAIIMDGNGRWAEQRGLPRLEGHRAGVKNVHPIVRSLNEQGIAYTILYAFSTENWRRPEDEVSGLFQILEETISREARELNKNGVRILHIGRLKGLSTKLRASIKGAIRLTAGNSGMKLGIAFNYGGRAEILDAVRRIMKESLDPDDLDEELFARYLYTPDFSDIDLVIRTGGEIRTSNFLIWQAAYSEYYFTPVLWPDFNEKELEKALQAYSQRQRRFGGL